MKDLMLTDEEIRFAKAEAYRLSWTHKPHPSYEKEKYLLTAEVKHLADMGLGFYETDAQFPANNRFIPLKEVLETE